MSVSVTDVHGLEPWCQKWRYSLPWKQHFHWAMPFSWYSSHLKFDWWISFKVFKLSYITYFHYYYYHNSDQTWFSYPLTFAWSLENSSGSAGLSDSGFNTSLAAQQLLVNIMFETYINIRFNHGFEVFNVGCGPRSILMTDAKQRALISTEGCNQC